MKQFVIQEDAERRKKWTYLTDGLDDDKRLQTEVLLENTEEWLTETSQTAQVGAFTTFAYPLVRRIFPKLIAQQLCSVQPMSQPTGKIFFLDFKYNDGGARVDAAVDVDYADSDEAGTVKEINFDISSTDVSAKQKKLKAKWTMEAQQDLRAYHGLDAENELMAVLGDELTREIDREIIQDITALATAGNVNWNINAPSGNPWDLIDPKIYKATLYDAIVDANNMVFKKRYRNATWLVADADTCTRLEKLEGFKLEESTDPAEFAISVSRFGTLKNRWIIYKDPWFDANKILMGFRGASWLETGYVYAPYIPLYTTPLIVDPDDFTPRRGLMSRYAKKMVIGDCFATVTLVSS